MPNLSSLAPVTTAISALSGLVLVSPQNTVGYQAQNPANADGTPSLAQLPEAILFHYEGEQKVIFESDITDHHVEDNTAVQDQIALKPEVISTQGYIGELNNVPPKILGYLQTAADKLSALSAYAPGLSATAALAYNEAFFLYQTAQTAVTSAASGVESLLGVGGESVINGQGLLAQMGQNRQQDAFQRFYLYWRQRRLFTVQTPWAVFQNMAIQRVEAVQDPETNVISTFNITFKMIRSASTSDSAGLATLASGRLLSQSATTTDLGTSSPIPSISVSQGISAQTAVA